LFLFGVVKGLVPLNYIPGAALELSSHSINRRRITIFLALFVQIGVVLASSLLSGCNSTSIMHLLANLSPTAPSNLTATAASSSQINLSWAAASEAGGMISNYLLERCQGSGCGNFAQIVTPSTTSFHDTALTSSTTYIYRVRASDAAGNLSP